MEEVNIMMRTNDSDDPHSTGVLAQQLLQTRGQGIAAFVQERVHSTSIGLEASTTFVEQLLAELESAIADYLPIHGADVLLLEHEAELELGSLISASSLTIRYVTERDAIIPVLGKFHAAFQRVLRYPRWTMAMLGLKMVSLMGCTRLLETFNEHIDDADVTANLRWLFALFDGHEVETDKQEKVSRINYLFRPACEQLTVAMQSHPNAHEVIMNEVVPILFALMDAFAISPDEANISESVITELTTTIAVLLEIKLPVPISTAFEILPQPDFAVEESKDSSHANENIHFMQRDDEKPQPSIVLAASIDLARTCEIVVSWLSHEGRRVAAATVVPSLCHTMQMGGCHTDEIHSIVAEIVTRLGELNFVQLADFSFCRASIESLRDIGLRGISFPEPLMQRMYFTLKNIMPQLQAALKTLNVDKAELRSIKATCSSIRDALAEVFVLWVHQHGCSYLDREHQADFLESVVEKLADPRIFADIIFATRPEVNDDEYRMAVERAIQPLQRALKQLDRYSKTASSRIVAGVTRMAIAAGGSIAGFADDLVVPLMGAKGKKTQKNKLVAIACILISSSLDDSFSLVEHAWVDEMINTLLEGVESYRARELSILYNIIQASDRLQKFVAAKCMSSPELLGHIVHEILVAWPVYEEDMDAVLLVLEIFASLLRDDTLRGTIDIAAVHTTVSTLSRNARQDDISELVTACQTVLHVLGRNEEIVHMPTME